MSQDLPRHDWLTPGIAPSFSVQCVGVTVTFCSENYAVDPNQSLCISLTA